MKTTSLIERTVMTFVVLVSCVACDQATKQVAIRELRGVPPRSYLGDIFRLQFAENRGAFLSLGATLSEDQRTLIFSGLVGIFLVGMTIYTVASKTLTPWQVIAMALLVGGGLSNWWDRVARGGLVVDFMNMGIGPVRTGIFNVADIAIMAGAFLMVGLGWNTKKPPPPSESTAPPPQPDPPAA